MPLPEHGSWLAKPTGSWSDQAHPIALLNQGTGEITLPLGCDLPSARAAWGSRGSSHIPGYPSALGAVVIQPVPKSLPTPQLNSNPQLPGPPVLSASLPSHLQHWDSDLRGPTLGLHLLLAPLSVPACPSAPLARHPAHPSAGVPGSLLYIPFLTPPPGGHAYSPVDKRKQGPYLSRVPERVKGRPSSGVRAWSMWGQSSFASAAFATSPFSLESSNI